MAVRVRVKLPEAVAAGEVFTIKSLIRHRMESGLRRDEDGEPIPRDIIDRFTAAFDGEVFFSVDIARAVSANPYLEFTARITDAGTFTFTWTDEAGEVVEHEQTVALKG